MPATEQQLRAIAFLAKDCRPHGARIWDVGGIFASLAKVRDRSLGSIIIAAVQAAEDRNALTPGVIPKAGPHWRTPEAAVVTTADKVPPADHCATCGHTKTACRIHWAGDHEFVTVAQARGLKRSAEASADIHEALAAEVKPMREPTHDATTVTPGAGRTRLETVEGVGTGAGRGDDPAPTEATSWVNGSADCPEAPAQAHPLDADAVRAEIGGGQ